MQEFTIIPILGRRVNVPHNDPSLFKVVGDRIAMTHDVGGVNFDLGRTRNCCVKSFGSVQWDAAANAEATKCLGLFELYDGTNRNHIYFDNGKVYVFDGTLTPVAVDASPGVVFANDNADLYSIVKVGSYMIFADKGEHTPYKWQHGDANLSKAIASGTEFVFRYLVVFQRRLLGLYTTETDGDIIVRWSTDWPTTAISALNYPAANQLYIPNDDNIIGGATMGTDRCYIYCENSINQIIYYPDYTAPFRIYTIVPTQSFSNHHSIVNLGDRHFGFNRNYGFCEYRGGEQFPYGGKPISEDIEADLRDIHSDYYNVIQGCFVPFTRELCWTIPMGGQGTPTHLVFYNIDNGQWRIENKVMRYIDSWRLYEAYSWNTLISDLGGTGAIWSSASNNSWAYYLAMRQRLVYGGTNGHLYYQAGENYIDGSPINGFRVEPIMDFGNPNRKDSIQEIWVDINESSAINLEFYHKAGNTVGEVDNASWSSIGTISCNSPEIACIRNIQKPGRFHQIKWGTFGVDTRFAVSKIVFKYQPLTER